MDYIFSLENGVAAIEQRVAESKWQRGHKVGDLEELLDKAEVLQK